MDQGNSSVSLNPDAVVATWLRLAPSTSVRRRYVDAIQMREGQHLRPTIRSSRSAVTPALLARLSRIISACLDIAVAALRRIRPKQHSRTWTIADQVRSTESGIRVAADRLRRTLSE